VAYDLPTPAELKAKIPAFAGVPDLTVEDAIDEAKASVDTSWIEADYKPAIIYMAAHIMTLNGVLYGADQFGAGAGVIAAGLVSKMKVGDVDVTLGNGAGGSSGGGSSAGCLASTPYGLRYVSLLRRNQPAIALV
jgi:hypothetical protein